MGKTSNPESWTQSIPCKIFLLIYKFDNYLKYFIFINKMWKILKNKKIISTFSLTSIFPLSVYNLKNYCLEEKEVKCPISITQKELLKYNNKERGIWISYKDSIYDITNFVENHPGGIDKIMLAAGKPLEPYWNQYRQHIEKKYVIEEILLPMKIGKLIDYDPNVKLEDPYLNDPIRDPNLEFHTYTPCNAETPKELILDNWITPNEYWYIRNHYPVPDINPKHYKLKIDGKDKLKSKEYDLEFLKKNFKKKEVITTIQCAGNKRSFYKTIEKTNGTQWDYGAISTAKWGGVSLSELLKESSLTIEDCREDLPKFIEFSAEESVKISIPIEKALNPFGDVILAYEMNGQDIPREHGYPLRLIVPGYVGVRNIKWVNSITINNNEVDSPWQSGISYKGLPHYIKNVKDIEINKLIAVNEQPVQSIIVEAKSSKNEDETTIRGYAYSGGGRGIIRVDVSIDNGINWHNAKLTDGSEQPINRSWAWTFWELKLPTPKKDFIVYCKATDASYNIQPEKSDYIWNLRGLNNNSWHKIKMKLK